MSSDQTSFDWDTVVNQIFEMIGADTAIYRSLWNYFRHRELKDLKKVA